MTPRDRTRTPPADRSLERAIARFRRSTPSARDDESPPRVTAAAFRALAEQRLRDMEREIGELRTRVNGLIFLVVGTVISQLVMKLVQ